MLWKYHAFTQIKQETLSWIVIVPLLLIPAGSPNLALGAELAISLRKKHHFQSSLLKELLRGPSGGARLSREENKSLLKQHNVLLLKAHPYPLPAP